MGLDVGLLLAIASAVIGAIGWYRSVVREGYSRERDYSHLRSDLQTYGQHLEESARDVEEIRSLLLELKARLIASGLIDRSEIR
jgi:hypothetical protein